ncbi:hypothetical protein [Salinicoccus roseus]|uniref:hypothetical protein n=1 Tax=Salinicoccus roseus TaxID=45670 RepID=UPI002300ABFE|nr:hypothetical protein [Salinicoccus roseus]
MNLKVKLHKRMFRGKDGKAYTKCSIVLFDEEIRCYRIVGSTKVKGGGSHHW